MGRFPMGLNITHKIRKKIILCCPAGNMYIEWTGEILGGIIITGIISIFLYWLIIVIARSKLEKNEKLFIIFCLAIFLILNIIQFIILFPTVEGY